MYIYRRNIMNLKQFFAIAQAIGLLLHPHGEVVIHDLKTGCIAHIVNNLSKRKVGDESLLDEIKNLSEIPDVFPLYFKTNWDGKRMRCVTATLRDRKGNPIGLLCINVDLSKWEDMQKFLQGFMEQIGEITKPEALFKDDWREKINEYVFIYLQEHGESLKTLTKEKKKKLIEALHIEGAFQAKNAASYIADVLEISRATLYNYLR